MLIFLPVHLPDIVGILGCAMYIVNYTLLTLRRLYGDTLTYFMLNIVAASCVLLSLGHDFNMAAAVIQAFFIGASVLAITIRLFRRRRSEP